MSDTLFVKNSTKILATWLNDVNTNTYSAANKAALAALTPALGLKVFVSSSDGGLFKAVVGAAATTYSDNGGAYCGTITIPTGGDGSIAWVRVDGGYNIGFGYQPEWWGAGGRGATDDTAAIQALFDSGLKRVDFSGDTYNYTNLTIDSEIHIKLLGATKLKQTTASGVGITVYNATAFNRCTIEGGYIEGSASAFVSGNNGLQVENVLHNLVVRDTVISGFGDAGFKPKGNCFGSNVYNLRIHTCYGHGIYSSNDNTGGGTFRNNAWTWTNVRVWNCTNGAFLDNIYSDWFDGLWIEDSAGGLGTGYALLIDNAISSNIDGIYIEWNYTSTAIPIAEMKNSVATYLNNIFLTTSSSSASELVKFTSSNTLCGLGKGRIKHQTSIAVGVNIAAASCDGTSIQDIQIQNCTTDVSDSGINTNHTDAGTTHTDTLFERVGTNTCIRTRKTIDTVDRIRLLSDGSMQFGDGTNPVDSGFGRQAANLVGTDNTTNLRAGDGTWDGSHLQLGTHHFWMNGNDYRGSIGAPVSATDGVLIATLT